jgi:hypothetical protein
MSADDNQPVRVSDPSVAEVKQGPKPIILNYTKWKKKGNNKVKEGKPKYSKGLKDIQCLECDVVHIAETGAMAFSKSINTYLEERGRSARKKKDGAIKDFLHNSAKATSTYMKETSDIPIDVADSLSKFTFRKNLRKGMRRASKRILLWPI